MIVGGVRLPRFEYETRNDNVLSLFVMAVEDILACGTTEYLSH